MAKLNLSSPQFLKPICTRTTCFAGSTATLEAVVTGRPIPLITWHKNGLRIAKHGRCQMQFEDSGRCSLILSEVSSDDEGEYECRARNRYGQVSCFGELYIEMEEGVTKFSGSSRHPVSQSGDEDNCEVTEGKSGLFILIDEGSQDDENSADEMGCKESISASEQIESIIEDLTMGDGSLSLSLGKDGAFVANASNQEDLPSAESKLLKSKALRHVCETLYERDAFEDADDCSTSTTLHGVKSPPPSQVQTSLCKKRLALQLHKATGVEENLHQALDRCKQNTTMQTQEFENIRSADVGGTWDFHSNLQSTKACSCNSNIKSTKASLESSTVAIGDSVVNNVAKCSIPGGSEGHRELTSIESGTGEEEMNPSKTSRRAKMNDVEERVISRRNTTGGTELSTTRRRGEKTVRRQRSNSDGGKDSEDVVRYGDANVDGEELEMLSSQQCPWESLEKIWRDSLPTESGDEPLPSDLEISNDEVFVDRSKEEQISPKKDPCVNAHGAKTVGSSQVTD